MDASGGQASGPVSGRSNLSSPDLFRGPMLHKLGPSMRMAQWVAGTSPAMTMEGLSLWTGPKRLCSLNTCDKGEPERLEGSPTRRFT